MIEVTALSVIPVTVRRPFSRKIAERRGARHDQVQMAKDLKIASRIQQAFMRIRDALMMDNLQYDWFKV